MAVKPDQKPAERTYECPALGSRLRKAEVCRLLARILRSGRDHIGRPLSLARLAELLEVSTRWIQLVAAGTEQPSDRLAARLAQALSLVLEEKMSFQRGSERRLEAVFGDEAAHVPPIRPKAFGVDLIVSKNGPPRLRMAALRPLLERDSGEVIEQLPPRRR